MYSLTLKSKCQLLALDYVPFTKKLDSMTIKTCLVALENKYGKTCLKCLYKAVLIKTNVLF